MRISDPKPVELVREVEEADEGSSASDLAADAAERKDTVSLREQAETEAAAAAVRAELSATRTTQLAQIEAAVRNGSYRPDPRQIAERILQSAALSAQIDAQLRGMM